VKRTDTDADVNISAFFSLGAGIKLIILLGMCHAKIKLRT